MGFSYEAEGKEESNSDVDDNASDDEDDEDEDEEDFNSDDSNDEGMEVIGKEFGVKRYGWLVYMDKKAKEEEKRQKEIIKGDPAIVSHFLHGSEKYHICFSSLDSQMSLIEETKSKGKKESFSNGTGKGKRSCRNYWYQSPPS